VGVGAQTGSKLGLEDEDADGCITALDFLRDVYDGNNAVAGRRVAVIGGGFTAVDSARTAVRLGAEEVFILYRRTRDEMPAVREEVDEAEEEGVQVMYLVSPKRIVVEGGKVRALEMINHVLGEKDASGRRRPVDVEATEFTLRVDTVISALGQELDLDAAACGLKLSKWDTIEADATTGATSVDGVFAGGDAVTGPQNLISAIAAGKRAAVAIDHYIAGDEASLVANPEPVAVKKDLVLRRSGDRTRQNRIPLQVVTPEERKKTLDDCTATMTEPEAVAEAARCLRCGCGEACGQCYRVCMSMAIQQKGGDYVIDEEKCHACGMCFRRCPNLNIEMVRTDE